MSRELDCEIVTDLLPLYVEGMVSDGSKKRIEEHINHCTDCKETFDNMTFKLETAQPSLEGLEVKKFLTKTKRMYFLYGLGGLSLAAIIVCFIVDLALHKGITWSLITGSAIAFADTYVYSLLEYKKNKGYPMMLVITIGTTFLLSVIQISSYCLMHTGTLWIFCYGYPIMLLWLGILWVPFLCRHILRWCLWDCLAAFMAVIIIGNYVTKLITGDCGWNDLWSLHHFIGNALGEIIGLLLFGIIGRIKKWRK
ncbi:MAG: zf-HC2 domain-containing protein [Lachnospiraceae bacterium]|nr:zf-HC2 domain-containing protein [Lachnospiraceae bacterium]